MVRANSRLNPMLSRDTSRPAGFVTLARFAVETVLVVPP